MIIKICVKDGGSLCISGVSEERLETPRDVRYRTRTALNVVENSSNRSSGNWLRYLFVNFQNCNKFGRYLVCYDRERHFVITLKSRKIKAFGHC